MSEPECECWMTPSEMWLSAASCGYGSGYEPGSQWEFNPDCPVHGRTDAMTPETALDGSCLACGQQTPPCWACEPAETEESTE